MQNIIEDILFQESPQTNPKLQILKTHFPECFDKGIRNFQAAGSQEMICFLTGKVENYTKSV